ncbi:MAG TPA: transcription antitermination factor NusB [Aestuariivirgaceae bacterium]
MHRSAARLAAVQALYQMDLAQTDIGEVLDQFSTRTGEANFDDGNVEGADFKFLKDIVEGVVREQRTIDPKIAESLAVTWKLERIESIMRAILRAGAYELMFRDDIPARAVISEYVDVARAFYDGEQPGFVNAVLDKLARSLASPKL